MPLKGLATATWKYANGRHNIVRGENVLKSRTLSFTTRSSTMTHGASDS
jgi:hypothetical protein